jgi:2-polyprenyl-3-methyl-5-hydroxy-6-metoxy-1,4-benzoquinol methylase
MGFEVVACDLRKWFLAYAKMKDDSGETRFVGANAYALPFRPDSFDLVLAGEIVEHLRSPERVLRECSRVLVEDGLLIVTTPNGKNLFSKLPTFGNVNARSMSCQLECQPDASGHLFLFAPRELSKLFEETGFKILRMGFIQSSIFSDRIELVAKKIPLYLSLQLDRLLNLFPGFRGYLSEGLVAVAKKNPN